MTCHGFGVYNAPLSKSPGLAGPHRFTEPNNLMKAKPVKSAPVKAKAKPASGLLGKLKSALGQKSASGHAAKKASSAKLPAKKPAPARPVAKMAQRPAAKPAPIAKSAPNKAPLKAQAKAPVKAAAHVPMKKSVAPAGTRSTFKGLLTEDHIRRMSDKDYMNEAQLDFFRTRLLQQRQEVLDRQSEVKDRLNQQETFADPADRATAEEEHWLDLRLRERESMLLHKIDEALRRIENKEYGYCEKTGDPIGIPRLLARPTATVCVDVKGQDERVEAQFRDR